MKFESQTQPKKTSACLPTFHASLLRESVVPSLLTLKGPNSCMAPYPNEEHPGPVYHQFSHLLIS